MTISYRVLIHMLHPEVIQREKGIADPKNRGPLPPKTRALPVQPAASSESGTQEKEGGGILLHLRFLASRSSSHFVVPYLSHKGGFHSPVE